MKYLRRGDMTLTKLAVFFKVVAIDYVVYGDTKHHVSFGFLKNDHTCYDV